MKRIENNLNELIRLPLSVSIISYNEESKISMMLESIKDIASEIVIVDSHSTDKTIEIAYNYGANIFIEDWKGHIAQKNSALEKCTQDWILCLDCDEVLSENLKESIITAIKHNVIKAYSLNRKTYYLGKFMNFAWRPDWKLRLISKELNARWEGLDPHDYLAIDSSEKTSRLQGDLFHYSYSGLKEHFSKTIDYAKISAESYFNCGKKFSVLKLILNPFIAFIRLYFINLGILDGIRGFIAAISSFVGTFLKYSFLYELQKK